ncbi:V-type ATPase 116kDa subunit family, putative [Angomonas deanei]|uniref:V-type proton ATPase subunit a n=1 Tax=Angomonas deanei TaxID=59799 RepID=A0A7G2C949_9TRYP|nr:V-type ATPase 116kDa subunit family, putative [Angomonas deanei]
MYVKREGCSGLWRSEDVVRLDLIIQREVLRNSVFRIGLLGKAQFIDLNEGVTAFARPFTEYVRRCEDIERKLVFVESEMIKSGLTFNENDINMCASIAEVEEMFLAGQLDLIEEEVRATETDLSAMIQSVEGLQNEINSNEEIKLLFNRVSQLVYESGEMEPSYDRPFQHLSRISSLLGLIDSAQVDVLYRLCYRVTRGNAIISINNEVEPMLNPKTGERDSYKSTFAVLSTSPKMIAKLKKLIENMRTTTYTLEEVESRGIQLQRADRMEEEEDAVEMRPTDGAVQTLQDLKEAIDGVRRRKESYFLDWYQKHRTYKVCLAMEKAVLNSMNSCTFSGATCTASVWIAAKYEPALEQALLSAVASSGEVHSVITRSDPCKNPPTYFETNKFTSSFQSIVDSYGMARYKEVNPGVFTIITFPYLFGIMYGDIGHGVLLLLITLYFISKERTWKASQLNEMVAMVFQGRYLLLLMSLFAIYMGFLYNDFFGFSVNIFPSGYTWASLEDVNLTVTQPIIPDGKPSVKPSHVYAFGMDSSWAETENKLEFYNSVKMKCAVIVGVVQMFAGIILSLCNHIYRRDWFRIAFLTVPEFIFLLCTFGYMSILIIVKWCTTWTDTSEAPSLLEIMTNFFLQPGNVPKNLFRGQAGLQVFLLIMAFLMVPIMLCGMPIIEYKKYRRHLARMAVLQPSDTFAEQATQSEQVIISSSDDGEDVFGDGADIIAEPSAHDDSEEYGENFDFSEVVIHYLIHTIEYVLSSVSNTASYLRLWALSLAHAQLSEVFFTFTIVNVLSADTSGALIALGVLVWLAVTLAVLVGMEALSAFLHALRLHWVEFQNKFYAGDGVGLEPFDLTSLDGRM